MNTYLEIITKNSLFSNLSEQDIRTLIESETSIIGRYKKNTVIMQEGELCHSIGFVLDGTLSVQQLSPCGKLINIQILPCGECFGLAFVYSPLPVYQYTLVTAEAASILYIPFARIEKLLEKSTVFCKNYITFLTHKVIFFQNKVRIFSQKDVRSRLILYLSAEFASSQNPAFKLRHSKTEIADLIGVARPSVPRELMHMQQDGLIDMQKGFVTLQRPDVFSFKI